MMTRPQKTAVNTAIRSGGQHFEPWHMTPSADKGRLDRGINDMTPHRKGSARHPAAQSWENMLREADTICEDWLRLSGFYRWWLDSVTGDDSPFTLNLSIANRIVSEPDFAAGTGQIHASPETALWLPRDMVVFAMAKPKKGLPRGISKKSANHRTYDARVRGFDSHGNRVMHRQAGESITALDLWCRARRNDTLSQLVERYSTHPEIDRVAELLGHFV